MSISKQRTYRAKHSNRIKLASAIWRKNNAQKRRAHYAVANAIKRGAMFRPTTCQKCGNTAALDAHHEDYSAPLDVKWLCRSCHFNAHEKKISECDKNYEFGEQHHSAKLTESSVANIRSDWACGTISKRALARKYRVSERNIRLILEGKTWKHTNS